MNKNLEMSFRNKYDTEMEGGKKEAEESKPEEQKPRMKLQLLDHLQNNSKYRKINEKNKKLS